MHKFGYWKKKFESQDLFQFSEDESGIAWLKIKSIIRKDIIEEFNDRYSLNLKSSRLNEYFEEIFDLYYSKKLSLKKIDNFLVYYNKAEIEGIEKKFDEIQSELYKLDHFTWGGDGNNSLDKQIVKYVKDNFKYNKIDHIIDNEINENTRNYTLNSWYNHWTTILTEHIFKSNENVISAVGKIKSVDFFIGDLPLDLKITSFPKGFLKDKRKEKGFEVELTAIKKIARQLDILISTDTDDDVLKYQLINQIKDKADKECIKKLNEIFEQNKLIINETENNPIELIKWLYENQGEMRFGSENRLFLLLIDTKNMNDSWKLKRNFELQKTKIENYLMNCSKKSFKIIDFVFKGKNYKTYADIIFIKK